MKAVGSRFVVAALLGTSALIAPSIANADVPAPSFTSPDHNNVDLSTGLVWYSMEEGGIGSGPGRVSMQRIWSEGAGWLDNWSGGLYQVTSAGVTKSYVQFGGISDTFTGSGSTWTADKANGATLTVESPSGNFIYTSSTGVKIAFHQQYNSGAGGIQFIVDNCPGADPATCQVPLNITYPSGLKFTVNFHTDFICIDRPGEPCFERDIYGRLGSVTSSAGYSLSVAYASDAIGAGPTPNPDWFKRTGVTFNNTANPPSPQPAISYAYGTNTISVTDPASRTWRFTTDNSGRLTAIRRPGSSSNNYIYTYAQNGTVSNATKDGVKDSYTLFDPIGGQRTETVTDPLGNSVRVAIDGSSGRPASYQNELGHTWAYQYDSNARLTKLTAPEGNNTQYAYDSRGNVTTVTNVAKAGSGLANIVTSANYDATCSSIVKCNKPNSTTDAKGNVTNYTYDATHGGVLTVTQPAPVTGAVHPQTRYTYSQVTSASGDLVYMPTKVAACQNASSCTGGGDETQTTAAYNSNLLPTSTSRRNGTGTLIATSTMTYDPRGNMLSVDGPLSGTADTTAFKYDLADQMVGGISPDPDSGGALRNRAMRLTYRPDGQVSKQEIGTTAGQTDADWAAFKSLQAVDFTFDSDSRPVRSKLSASGTDYALTQANYDSLGRVNCTAARMNPAIYGSLPSSACTLGNQGAFGRDRISQNDYDAASQQIDLKVGVGTSDSATEWALTFTPNGNVQNLTDGEENLTAFYYDGFDRLAVTDFPVLTKGAHASDVSNYEKRTYDVNSNVVSLRKRSGTSIGYTYDALNRVIHKGGTGVADADFGYDNLGRLLTATNSAGLGTTNDYDALSRLTSSSSDIGGTAHPMSYLYDLADSRTRVTWWDGFYVDYDRLITGDLSKVRANGAVSGSNVLATYGYDNLGRRTSLGRGNGATTTYTYDPVSRLASLHDFAGTANDVTRTLTYNPASQIVSETISNDAFASNVPDRGTTTFTTNGLNENKTIDDGAVTYDANGNLTFEPWLNHSFSYNAEDQMTAASWLSATAGFTYDPLGRLDTYNPSSGAFRRFVYDPASPADAVTAELDNSGAIVDRYIRGDAPEEVLLQYIGSGSSSFRYYHVDERLSPIAWSDETGALSNVMHYDEYGIPNPANLGRFQYTGQMWLSEVSEYFYKARTYSANMGRFLQTDPLGYSSGPNLYEYVLNDPVNLVDPLGLKDSGVNCYDTPSDPRCFVTVTGKRPDEINVYGTGPAFPGADLAAIRTTGSLLAGLGLAYGGRLLSSLLQLPNPLVKHPALQCAGSALSRNKGTLALDALSIGASFVPGGNAALSAAASVAGSYAGVATVGVGIANHNGVQAAEGATGHYLSAAAGLSEGASGVMSNLPVAGQAFAVSVTALDVGNALNEEGCFGAHP